MYPLSAAGLGEVLAQLVIAAPQGQEPCVVLRLLFPPSIVMAAIGFPDGVCASRISAAFASTTGDKMRMNRRCIVADLSCQSPSKTLARAPSPVSHVYPTRFVGLDMGLRKPPPEVSASVKRPFQSSASAGHPG